MMIRQVGPGVIICGGGRWVRNTFLVMNCVVVEPSERTETKDVQKSADCQVIPAKGPNSTIFFTQFSNPPFSFWKVSWQQLLNMYFLL